MHNIEAKGLGGGVADGSQKMEACLPSGRALPASMLSSTARCLRRGYCLCGTPSPNCSLTAATAPLQLPPPPRCARRRSRSGNDRKRKRSVGQDEAADITGFLAVKTYLLEGERDVSKFDIFSKRQKAVRGETPDVYSYDPIPGALRVQVVHIMYDTLGNEEQYTSMKHVKEAYDAVTDALCREYGIFRLPIEYNGKRNKMKDLVNFILQGDDTENIIDAIELFFRLAGGCMRIPKYRVRNLFWGTPSGDADCPLEELAINAEKLAIEELNGRFKEHGIGYCFTGGQIVRIDSEFVHSEVVRPALRILDRQQYAGAREEFLKAHEHRRNGNAKEALNECLKSLESVMKSICDKRGWAYDERATASKLIDICFDNGLVPSFWQSQFDALRSLLKSGVPTARNRLGGHGQGATPKPVPGYVAGYALHMTAAAIVFLADAEAGGSAS